ncbi:MAG TPA: hypothetical protein VFC06_00455 [Demequina sp.]|nr:hypothetical protein [Demequina sp.]
MSVAQPVMHSLPFEGYPRRWLSVDLLDIARQRAAGWPDFHPEDFCHRCGAANVCWFTDSTTWNDVMEDETRWNGILCVPCFIALTEDRVGGCAWRLTRDEYGSEVLTLLHVGDPDGAS